MDANIDAFTYLAQPDQVDAALRHARAVRARIDRTGPRTRRDEFMYRQALAAEGLTDDSVRRAIEVFRDRELFYHRPTYRAAVAVMRRWLDLLALQMPLSDTVTLASVTDDDGRRVMLAAMMKVGAGRVFVIAGEHPLSNAGLGEEDNGAFLGIPAGRIGSFRPHDESPD